MATAAASLDDQRIAGYDPLVPPQLLKHEIAVRLQPVLWLLRLERALHAAKQPPDLRSRPLRPGAYPSLRSYDCHSQITKEAEATIAKGRAEAAACINRTDSRLLIIIGPCSIHSPSEALEYARRLKALSDTLPGLVVVMRAYLCVLRPLPARRCFAVADRPRASSPVTE
jgi:3-deoxy-D-arabino-heptulosonate 7-phosphate (DAHP) synthase